MLVYDVRGDIKAIEKHLTSLGRDQVPFATTLALTRTAKFVEQKIKEEIPRVFDRPTRYTLNSTWVDPATKQRQWAQVRIKDEAVKSINAMKWLAPQVYGGGRILKRSEQWLIANGRMPPGHYLVPAKSMELDAHGNVSRGQLQIILSDLQSNFDPTKNTTARSKQRRLRSRTKRPMFYFSTWPASKKTAHLRPGIYKRTHLAWGAPIRPAFIFVKRVRYKKRLRFFEIADQTAHMRFPIEFALAMRFALATAR